MKTKFGAIRSVFFGTEKYEDYEYEILAEDMHILRVFSGFALVIFVVLYLFSAFGDTISMNARIYPYFLTCLVCIFTLAMWAKPYRSALCYVLIYGFIVLMLAYGLVLATIISPEDITVSYIVIMLAAPMAFALPYRATNLLLVVGIAVYCVAAKHTQSQEIFELNLFDVIPYGIMSIIANTYLMKVKLQRFAFKKKNETLEEENASTLKQIDDFENYITDMMRFASTDDEADAVLNSILHYICESTDSDRAYIFERNEHNGYDNTYEACRKGMVEQKEKLMDLPYENALSEWIKRFEKDSNVLIDDLEEYRNINPAMYEILRQHGVSRLVAGPITVNNEIIGFYGVDNPPENNLENLSDLITFGEFVFSMMIRLRNSARALEDGSLHDQLTGCLNRKALHGHIPEISQNLPCTVIECDLNGLKAVNDNQGHEAGDRFIVTVADVLVKVFGRGNVYRIGGDEFAIVLSAKPCADSKLLFDRCCEELGDKASLGCAACESGSFDFDELMKLADKEMYKNKELYYQTAKRYR